MAKPYLTVGCKAYIDSFSGLVPCIVQQITNDTVVSKITAARPGYKVGEIVHSTHRYTVPRTAVFTRLGQFRIRYYS